MKTAVSKFLANRMPKRLVYWTLIRAGAEHIGFREEVPAVPFMTVLQRAGDALREKAR